MICVSVMGQLGAVLSRLEGEREGGGGGGASNNRLSSRHTVYMSHSLARALISRRRRSAVRGSGCVQEAELKICCLQRQSSAESVSHNNNNKKGFITINTFSLSPPFSIPFFFLRHIVSSQKKKKTCMHSKTCTNLMQTHSHRHTV